MTQFYIPTSGTVALATGQRFKVHKGVHDIPDALSNSHEANAYGIKPVSEMEDDEWKMLGLPAPPRHPDILTPKLKDDDAKSAKALPKAE